MKGYLILSEVRCGTNWVGSMADNTGLMGVSGEWLAWHKTKNPIQKFDGPGFFDHVIQASSTPNQRFAIKIFPDHIHRINQIYNYDFIRKCRQTHPVKIIQLQRRDRISQAVSFARSTQTRQWRSDLPKEKEAVYDFPLICRAYFGAGRSNAFWQDYLAINNIEHETYYYEDLLTSIDKYRKSLTGFLDVEESIEWQTELQIQRDSVSQEWCDRFREDVDKHGMIDYILPVKQTPSRGKKLFSRIARRLHLKSN